MNELCRAEVYAFHRFLTKWYGGTGDPDRLLFTELADVLANDFRMVTPQGRIYTKDQLKQHIWDAYGAHAGAKRPFKVWVERFDGRELSDLLHLCTYEEWQWVDARTRIRQSTALFRVNEDNRNGVEWQHVHETWLIPAKPEPAATE